MVNWTSSSLLFSNYFMYLAVVMWCGWRCSIMKIVDHCYRCCYHCHDNDDDMHVTSVTVQSREITATRKQSWNKTRTFFGRMSLLLSLSLLLLQFKKVGIDEIIIIGGGSSIGIVHMEKIWDEILYDVVREQWKEEWIRNRKERKGWEGNDQVWEKGWILMDG